MCLADVVDILSKDNYAQLERMLHETLHSGAAMVGHHMKLGGLADRNQPDITYDFGAEGLMVLKGDLK